MARMAATALMAKMVFLFRGHLGRKARQVGAFKARKVYPEGPFRVRQERTERRESADRRVRRLLAQLVFLANVARLARALSAHEGREVPRDRPVKALLARPAKVLLAYVGCEVFRGQSAKVSKAHRARPGATALMELMAKSANVAPRAIRASGG